MKTHIIHGSRFILPVRETLAQGLILSARTLDSLVHMKNDIILLPPDQTPSRKVRVTYGVKDRQMAGGHQTGKDPLVEDPLPVPGTLLEE